LLITVSKLFKSEIFVKLLFFLDGNLNEPIIIRKPNPLSPDSTARILRDALSRSAKLALAMTDKVDLEEADFTDK